MTILQAGSWVPTPTPKKPPSETAARLASVGPAPGLIPGGDRDCHLAGAAGAVGDPSPAQSQRPPGLCLLGWFGSQDSGLKIQLQQCDPTPQPSMGQTSFPGKPTGYDFFIQVVGKMRDSGSLPPPSPNHCPTLLSKQRANLVPRTRKMEGGAVEARKAEIRSEQQDHFLGIVNPEL